ncbi:MAG: hypothetical protein WDN66_02795 [Candidatus Saccharibacteria bacterium]
MSFIQFEREYRSLGHDPVTELCWRARQVLGGHMLDAVDVRGEDYEKQIEAYDAGAIDISPIEDDEEEFPVMHETAAVTINDRQQANLSNRPFLLDGSDQIIQYTSPGFVALHIEPWGLEYSQTPTSLDGCDQVIFKLPHDLVEEAAIYRGFSLDEDNQIDHLTKEVHSLEDFLGNLNKSLIDLMVSNQGYWDVTYLSQTPEPSLDLLLESLDQSD